MLKVPLKILDKLFGTLLMYQVGTPLESLQILIKDILISGNMLQTLMRII